MALPVLLTDSDIHTPTRIYTLFPIQTRRIPVYSGFARTIAYSIAQNSFQYEYEGDRVVHVPPLPRKKQSHFDGQPGTAVPGVVRYRGFGGGSCMLFGAMIKPGHQTFCTCLFKLSHRLGHALYECMFQIKSYTLA
jgi:hypothetical protein